MIIHQVHLDNKIFGRIKKVFYYLVMTKKKHGMTPAQVKIKTTLIPLRARISVRRGTLRKNYVFTMNFNYPPNM